MKHYRVSNAEAAGNGGYTDIVEIEFGDLTETAVNTAQTIQLISVPIGTAVLGAEYRLNTPFTDASDAAFNVTSMEVGDGSDVDRFIVSKELNSNGTEVLYWATAQATATLPFMFTAADTIDAKFTSMADKALNDIDAGKVTIRLRLSRP
jgi:hypothetical protein